MITTEYPFLCAIYSDTLMNVFYAQAIDGTGYAQALIKKLAKKLS